MAEHGQQTMKCGIPGFLPMVSAADAPFTAARRSRHRADLLRSKQATLQVIRYRFTTQKVRRPELFRCNLIRDFPQTLVKHGQEMHRMDSKQGNEHSHLFVLATLKELNSKRPGLHMVHV